MSTADIVILALILIPGISGLHRGFVRTVAGLAGTVVNWYAALRLCPYAVDKLYTFAPLVKSAAAMTAKAPDPDKAVHIMFVAAGFVICYILINVVIKIIISIANDIASLPLLNGINRAGGLIAGLAEGFILVCFVFLLLGLIGGMLPADFMTALQRSELGSWFLTSNPLAGLVPAGLYKLYQWKGKIL